MMLSNPQFSDIQVPRDRIFVLNGQDFVVDWGEDRVESLISSRYYPVDAIKSRHKITLYELDQLVNGGYVLRYDDDYVYLDVNRTANAIEQQRQYYLHTRYTKPHLDEIIEWLRAANLYESYAVRTLENFVIIRGKNGLGFRSLEDVEAARQLVLSAVPQLSQTVIAFVDVFA
ncbi:hypothetical protein G4Y79_17445 [Phototrophicus methaneseepsis]|uniref:Uncharacterized protein n=1 Tax=Phototrophicus methaneseepsis TaxID=2710758 RepID=A0A7S8IE50_9CHLR|nr:hypothetical protein [Phototrophicus methaneseepsis]QPC81463.1 hypothetical protein G4Y79_17445 [Phototrophicus methaneseepsis]